MPDCPRYQVSPRAPHLGGGWRLQCFDGDVEVAGGVFPLDAELEHVEADNEAYLDARGEGEAWLAERMSNGATQDLVNVGPGDI